MADLKISQLAALASADLAAGDLLPVVDLSASETKKITVTDFTGKAVTLIADATIPGAKILFGASQVPGTALVDGGVSTAKLADDAVTAAKLGNESTVDLVTTLPATGAFVGQLALDTDDLKVYCWNGSSWQSIKAAGSINTVNGDSSGIVNITVTTSGDTVTIATTLDNTAAAGQFLAGPTAAAGAVSYRTIAAGDLPTASTTAKGAVQVNGNGLAMSGDTLQINNTVTANSAAYHVVQYTSKGLVSAGRTIQSGDLPLAGASAVGAIYPGTGLSVAVDGQLNHTNTVTPGTSPKVTYNAQGHITGGASLAASDIPNLDASKITTGSLISDVLGAKTVTSAKLADYSTVKFGGASSTNGIVTFPVPEFTGQLFFDSSNGDLYLYDGNTWQPVTVISGDLIYAGTYDASTNTVKSVTTAGSAAGLVVGASLPAGSAARNRYYVVVSDSGNGVSPAPITALAPPDMLVCNGSTWDLVDVSNAIAGQIASNISFTPYANLASTNVQTALQELDDEKLAKAGGIVTGALEIGTTGSLVFEGATADGFETTLGVVDPTADRTVLLPNSSGTLITTGDTGAITSTMIADGTIVNADINASAAIVDTKLATISTAGKVANSATTATNANTASAIVARDASGNFTAGTITASLTGAASLNVLKAGDTMTGALGITAGTAAAPGAFFSGDTNTGLYSPGADQVAISTGGTGRLFVDASGRAGIGTSSPRSSLDVAGTTDITWTSGADAIKGLLTVGTQGTAGGSLFVHTPSLSATYGAGFAVNGSYSNPGGIGTAVINLKALGVCSNGGYDSALAFHTSSNTTSAERLRITGDGKVGIGTSAPAYLLHTQVSNNTAYTSTSASLLVPANTLHFVANADNTTANTGAFTAWAASGTGFSSVWYAGVDGGTGSYTGPFVIGRRSGSISYEEVLRIDSSGRVGIGTTSPGAPVHVSKGSAGETLRLAGDSANVRHLSFTSSDAGIFTGAQWDRNINSSGGIHTWSINATERARIDSSGRLLVGTSAALNVFNYRQQGGNLGSLQAVTVGAGANTPTLANFAAATYAQQLSFVKSRGTAIDDYTIVADGDNLGSIYFFGADGQDVSTAGSAIISQVDGTPGANDMPGRLVFSTTADGAATPTERMVIKADGKVGIGTSSPGAALHVNGTELRVETSSASDGFIRFINTSGSMSVGMSGGATNALLIYDRTNNHVAYSYNGGANGSHIWAINNQERARIDSSGRLLVGTSAARNSLFNVVNTYGGLFQVEGTGQFGGTRGAAVITNNSSIAGAFPYLVLAKANGDSIGSTTIVSNGNTVGALSFQGSDGSEFVESAKIEAAVDGTPGANAMPGRLVFSTTADGAASPTERLRISQNGRITVANSSLGTPSAIGNTSGTITLDLATANHFSLTLNANATNTLANPSNQTAGQSGAIVITQDATGSRTLAYGSNWKFPGGTAPTLTTTANAVDVLVYYVESATRITARLISDVK